MQAMQVMQATQAPAQATQVKVQKVTSQLKRGDIVIIDDDKLLVLDVYDAEIIFTIDPWGMVMQYSHSPSELLQVVGHHDIGAVIGKLVKLLQ